MPVAVALPLVALFVAAFLIMLAKSWDATFGPMFEALATYFDDRHLRIPHVYTIHFDFIGRAFRAVNSKVRAGLLAAIAFTSEPLTIFLRYMAQVLERPVLELSDLTADLFHTLGNLRRFVIPAMIATALGPIAALAYLLRSQVASLTKRAPVHIVHEITHIATHTVTNTVTKALAIPRTGLGRLEREGDALAGRVSDLARGARAQAARLAHLNRLLTAAAAAGLVAAALGRLGLGWARCSRVRKVGRQLCGMDSFLLDALLAETLVIVSVISLEEFARAMLAAQEEITPAILAGFKELRDVKPRRFAGYTGTLG